MTNFPASIDTFPRPVATDPLSNPAHAALHVAISDAITAMQQNIGVTGELDPATVRGALAGKAPLVHTHNYAPLVHGHAITDVTNLRSELDALQAGIDNASVSPLTAKGDLFGRDAVDSARVPVGLPGQILTADPASPTGLRWRDEVISPVGGITLTYQFDSGLTAAATTGEYRLNNANPALATQAFVNSTTQPGNDASVIWDNLDVGDYMTFWRTSGGAGSQAFKLTSKPVAAGVAPNKVYTMGVVVVGTPSGSIPNNATVAINTISTPAATLPAGGNIGSRLTKQSGTDYDVFWDDTKLIRWAGDVGIGPLSFDGNPTFNGNRIFGVFGGALPGRTYFQNVLPNDVTAIGAAPSGTGTTSLWQAFNGSDPSNAANIQLRANSTNVTINSTASGAAALVPLSFQMNNVEQARMNTDGTWTFISPAQFSSNVAVLGGLGVGIGTPGAPLDVATGSGRIMFRTSGPNNSIDSILADNSAFAPINFTAAGYVLQGGSVNIPQGDLIVAGSFQAPQINGGNVRADNGRIDNTFTPPDLSGGSWNDANIRIEAGGTSLEFPRIGFHRPGVGVAAAFYFRGLNAEGPQFGVVGSNGADRDLLHNGNGVTLATPQTVTGRKIFESQTTDGSGDLRVTRAVDAKSGAILFGDDNEVFIFRVNDVQDFLNISCELVMSGNVRPGSNPALPPEFSLGTASNRWSQVFAASGTINTSDAREKTPVAALTAQELAAAKELGQAIGTYKWLGAIAAKGASARKHIGVTAQSVIEVMEAHGLDAMEYGFVCHDAWEASTVQEPFTGEDMVMRSREVPAGDRYGVRYDELLAFIAAGFEARLAALEN